MNERELSPPQQGLVRSHLHLVEPIARIYLARYRGLASLDELISAGRQGLVESALRFDPSKNPKFDEFAPFRIRGAMMDHIRKELRHERAVVICAAASGYRQVASSVRTMDLLDDNDERIRLRLDDYADAIHGSMFAAMVGQLGRVHGEEGVVLRHQYAAAISALDAEVSRFPDEERTLLRLRYYDELSFEDIAHHFQRNARAVRELHDLLVRRLGRGLRERGVVSPPSPEGRPLSAPP